MSDLDDPYLPERIRRALAEADQVGELDVQVVVRAGRIILTGNVADASRRDQITEIVERLVPEHIVCNEIDVMHLADPTAEERLG